MLHLLRARCQRQGDGNRITAAIGIAPAIDSPAHCDLLVTHFFLDCLSQAEVKALAERAGAHCQPGFLWLLSDFGLPRHRLARGLALLYIRLLYLAFRLLTNLQTQQLPNAGEALLATGFHRVARAQWLGGFLYAELWEHP